MVYSCQKLVKHTVLFLDDSNKNIHYKISLDIEANTPYTIRIVFNTLAL